MYKSVKNAREVIREGHVENDLVRAETNAFINARIATQSCLQGLSISFLVCGKFP